MLMADIPTYGSDLTNHKLWYTKPAAQYMDGLPVGTGRLAAMVLGGIKRERIALNHEWLWRGNHRRRDVPERADRLAEVRRLLLTEQWEDAARAANDAFGGLGGFSGQPHAVDPYSPAGDLYFEINHNSISDYRRELDLSTAQVSIDFNTGGGPIRRDTVAHLTEDRILTRIHMPGESFDTDIWLDRLVDPQCRLRLKADDTGLRMDGRFESGLRFRVQAAVRSDGDTEIVGQRLRIRNAHEILIAVNIGVAVRGHSADAECGPPLLPAGDWDAWVAAHRAEHQRHFGGLTLEIPVSTPDLPTDRRIEAFRRGAEDPALPLLYFDYGRYLLCASCATAEQPPNLQGKWNEDLRPPWECDLHQDINLQMCYWPAEAGHLQSYTNALFTHIETFLPHARRAARRLYGCRGVWFPIQTDPWGRATPESYGWSVWIGAAPWLAQHLWMHWEYGRDTNFLRERAYPFFREIVAFYEDYLVKGKDGELMILPSQSPENRFKESGPLFPVSIGINAAMDVALAHDAFRYAIEAARTLDCDSQKRKRWEAIKARLPKLKIGSDGRLLEWDREFTEAEPGHRHLSHLYALYPGDQITPETPELWDAARKSLDYRLSHFGGHTGWSRAWTACCFARLGEGDSAMQHLKALITDFATDSLLDLHPPAIFQIDGNLGGTAAVLEMLLQSYHNELHFLPALPSAWPEGRVEGLRARGGFEVAMEWQAGRLVNASIKAVHDGDCTIRAAGETWQVLDDEGTALTLRRPSADRLVFAAAAGGTYRVVI